MKRFVLSVIAALASASAVFAVDWSIRDISVSVRLYGDGSAVVREVWDMTAREGTEVYVPRENLGDITISNLTVMDETGRQYVCENGWNVDRTLSQKAGRCGIARTSRGVELCWGIGEYGSHTYTVQYQMSSAVKSLQDYDMMHLQLVNDEMAASPKHVKVTVEAVDRQIDTSWVRLWGFGYVGNATFEGGKAVFESTERFSRESSVIALLRFEKGVFDSPSTQDRSFYEVLGKAREGAEFSDSVKLTFWQKVEAFLEEVFYLLLTALLFIFPFIASLKSGKMTKRQKRKLLGTDPDKVDWYRELPFGGDIYQTDFVLDRFETKRQDNAVASAIILRLLQKGYLYVRKDSKDKVEILFDAFKDPQALDDAELGLYTMMKEASGDDGILQDKEFSKWSSKSANKATVRTWASRIASDAKTSLKASDAYNGQKFTESGKVEAQHVFGFRNFLRDFTLVDKRESIEVTLWQDYLVFASLYGIADKVAAELKDIDPKAFEQVMPYDYTTYYDVVRMSDTLARAITNARYVQPAQMTSKGFGGSFGGFGGGASFGGGGGFSGGGHGGGVR